jgi:ankyrin repeat protein
MDADDMPPPLLPTQFDRDRAFVRACQREDIVTAERLLMGGANPNVVDSATGETRLHRACEEGASAFATLLLRYGANAHPKDNQGVTPLHSACKRGHDGCAEALLAFGADVSAVDKLKRTPLHFAVVTRQVWPRQSTFCAKLLLEYGADVDARDNELLTPLHYAFHSRSSRCARLLLEAGADLNARSDGGATPRYYAVRGGDGLDDPRHEEKVKCVAILQTADHLQEERPLAVGAPRSLGWTPSTHTLLRSSFWERDAVESALRALLLAEERRAGCALGEDVVTAVLRAVAR